MRNKFSIGSLILIVLLINVFSDVIEDGDLFGIPSFLGYFILFGVITNLIARANNKKTKQKRAEEHISGAKEWTNYEQKTTSYTTHECEYCGHVNHTSNEYCESCGAKQLPQ